MIGNLYEVVANASDLEFDSRFQSWVKTVTGIAPDKEGFYSIKGAFVKKGTVDYEVKTSLFLVSSANGSRNRQITSYQLVQMDEEGTLTPYGPLETDRERGAALRLRQPIQDWLNANKPQPKPELVPSKNTDTLIAHLTDVHEAAKGVVYELRGVEQSPLNDALELMCIKLQLLTAYLQTTLKEK